jgi:heptosyltransferase-1
MQRVLLVKTSSLGDVVHNFPVVTDILAAYPQASITWAVEEPYVDLVRLHPGVRSVLPVAMRRWRRTLLRRETRAEISACCATLRATEYDAIIDTQGLLKSALVTRVARGVRYGLDWESSREPLFAFYDHRLNVPWGQHAVIRNRKLAALALGYEPDGPADYGLRAPQVRPPWAPVTPYAVLLHGTSAREKLWPEDQWVELGRTLSERGMSCVIAWGSEPERERSVRFADAIPAAIVAPRMSLDVASALIAHAACAFGVDTGLAHLAGALGVRTVGIYCATDPIATGLYGGARAANCGGIGQPPTVAAVIACWLGMQ